MCATSDDALEYDDEARTDGADTGEKTWYDDVTVPSAAAVAGVASQLQPTGPAGDGVRPSPEPNNAKYAIGDSTRLGVLSRGTPGNGLCSSIGVFSGDVTSVVGRMARQLVAVASILLLVLSAVSAADG